MVSFLVEDTTGELRAGYFYVLFPGHLLAGISVHRDTIVSKGTFQEGLVEDRLIYSDGERRTVEEIRDCPLSDRHVAATELREISLCLCGGTEVGPIVPHVDCLLVNGHLKHLLERSRLRGCRFVRAHIAVNQSGISDPEIHALDPSGRDPSRPLRVVPESENRCPGCGYGPLFCAVCGTELFTCPNCHEGCVVPQRDAKTAEKRIILTHQRAELGIVDGKRWDGSDFMGYGLPLVTKRVVDYLVRVGAKPFKAHPYLVDVSGLTADQLTRLEGIREPVVDREENDRCVGA